MALRGDELEISSSLGHNSERTRRRDQTVHHSNASLIFSTNPSPTLDHHHHQLMPIPQPTRKDLDPDLEPDPDTSPEPTPISTTEVPPPTMANRMTQKASTGGERPARYRECQKNHAASTGGHVVDGCGEFMPSGEEGTPEAMKCAACECHRSFHRKEIDFDRKDPSVSQLHRKNTSSSPVFYSSKNPLQQQVVYSTAQIAPRRMIMNFAGSGGGGPAESSSEDLNMFHHLHRGRSDVIINKGLMEQQKGLKKRFRTKFNEDQKEKMLEFAKKLGWRIQKKDEQEIERFCSQVNVKRHVFKVWMHNNKQAMKKKLS